MWSKERKSKETRCPGRAVVAHEATDMTVVKGRAERLGQRIGGVDDVWNMRQNNFAVRFPVLNREKC